MAFERFFPFRSVSGDRKYSAEDWAAYFAQFIGNGVFYNDANSLKVVENEDMKIAVKPGAGFAAGRMYMLEDGKVLDIETADGAVDRIDRVVLRCDYVNRLMSVEVIKGGYGSTAPAITRNADVFELALADVYVKAGTLEITAADITDQRLNTELCGIVTGLIEQADTTEIFNQLQAYFNQFKGRTEADLQAFKNKTNADIQEFENNMMADFEEWYENYKAVLSGDAAGNLLKLIEETQHGLENQIVETTAEKMERCKAGGVQIVDMLGKSEQKTLTGSNKLDLSKVTFNNGKLYDNETGSVKANMKDSYYISVITTELNDILINSLGSKFTFAVDNNYSRNISVIIKGSRTDGSTYQETTAQKANSVTVTVENNFAAITSVEFRFGRDITVYTDESTVYTGLRFVQGSEALNHEPYTGGIPTPNPEYQEHVVSAGQKMVDGYQLFDKSKAINVTETETGFSFTNTGANGSPVSLGLLKDVAPSIKAGDKVTHYGTVINSDMGVNTHFYLRGTQQAWTSGTFVTITQEDLDGILYAYGRANELCEYNNVIITKVENAPYEPYNGGVKGACETGIKYKIKGKNLLNIDEPLKRNTFINADGELVANGGYNCYRFPLSTDLSVSYKYEDGFDGFRYGIEKDGKITRSVNTNGVISVLATQGEYLWLSFAPNSLYDVQVEKGTKATEYEPYTEQELKINRVLRGIPVTAEWLANYTDEKGQMRRADYIDVKRKVLVQTVGAYTVNQVLSYDFTESALKWQYGLYFTENINKLKGTSAKHYTNVMNDKFVMVSQSVEGLEETGTCCGFYGHAHGIEFRFRLLKSKYATAEEAKNAILGSTVYYPLTEPVEIPLTDEEIIALHSIMSGDKVTYMECENEVKPVTTKRYGVTEVGALTLENKNLHTVNETLRKNQLTKADFIVSGDTLILGWL